MHNSLRGLRIGELLALRWREVNLAQGRLTVLDSKTEAGVREIDIWPELHDVLAAHKAAAHHAKPTCSPPRPAKPTPARTSPRASSAPWSAPTKRSPARDVSSIPVELSRTRCDACSPRCCTCAARTPSTSCTRWATPTPSSPCASTPRLWANNAAADPGHGSSVCSTERGGPHRTSKYILTGRRL
jgi:hypothetical protein